MWGNNHNIKLTETQYNKESVARAMKTKSHVDILTTNVIYVGTGRSVSRI